ncbi:hypothetical protein PAENIP36_65110 [Paenibacillus sp. P36]
MTILTAVESVRLGWQVHDKGYTMNQDRTAGCPLIMLGWQVSEWENFHNIRIKKRLLIGRYRPYKAASLFRFGYLLAETVSISFTLW